MLHLKLQNKEDIPVVTYKVGSTVRNKILNYKDTVNSIFLEEDGPFTMNSSSCDCENSQFCDPDHKHIITGDFRFVENGKLRKLLTKRPNYREPKTVNFHKALIEIKMAINNCTEKLAEKYTINIRDFQRWKDSVINKVENKINLLKNKIKPEMTKPVLCDPEVITYLQSLHERFVIVTIDKAANNYAFICKVLGFTLLDYLQKLKIQAMLIPLILKYRLIKTKSSKRILNSVTNLDLMFQKMKSLCQLCIGCLKYIKSQ